MNQANGMPGLLRWMRYSALGFLLLIPLCVLAVRAGLWQPGLLLFALACLASTALIILSIALLLAPRFAPWRQAIVRHAFYALPGTLLLLALVNSVGDAPRIHDITTDTIDPPAFMAAAQQRGAGANSLDIDANTIAQQRAAYPDVKTLDSALSVDQAFDRALQVASDLGWEVYHQDRDTGAIEAVATTRIMGFRDDVVIRVRDSAAGTQVDLRSVSRVGQGDMGANARRIRAFRDAFQPAG